MKTDYFTPLVKGGNGQLLSHRFSENLWWYTAGDSRNPPQADPVIPSLHPFPGDPLYRGQRGPQ
jgi:hypothetical protein